jgi:hypothetical protein
MLTCIVRSSGYHPIAAILSAFQVLVKALRNPSWATNTEQHNSVTAVQEEDGGTDVGVSEQLLNRPENGW